MATESTLEEVQDLYAQMGLATASERARFASERPAPKSVIFDVVVSNTSRPAFDNA